ncbi:hypothetical protein [Streptomyces sp. NPDC001843]|uniref:hypothetical protein n=1 Tax=Streptomyces sp. NPDC001843 TaxID=3364617 RepID=UPI0036ABC1BE
MGESDEGEMTASSEGEAEPAGQVDGSGGRVSAWVQNHTPLAIPIAGPLSAQWSCKITPLPDVSELQVRLVDSRGVNETLQWVVEENAGSAPALSKVNGSELLAQKTLSRQGARGGAAAASGEGRPG